jgi:hypothetical protein
MRDDRKQFMLTTAVAATFVSIWIRLVGERLVELEERWPDGRVPLDDVVTVGELDRRLAPIEARQEPSTGDGPAEAG